eukprot:6612158-Lingulodinium_polyedra.AAC.1
MRRKIHLSAAWICSRDGAVTRARRRLEQRARQALADALAVLETHQAGHLGRNAAALQRVVEVEPCGHVE